MPTTDQKADLLFKKFFGKGSSGQTLQYFNEPITGNQSVFSSQIWTDSDQIPDVAQNIPGVLEQIQDLSLIAIPGQTNAYYHPQLKNSIPFNFSDNGSYIPVLKTQTNQIIVFGQNDWVIDIATGMLTFYAGVPAGVNPANPPKITFWKYIGRIGLNDISSESFRDMVIDVLASSSFVVTKSYYVDDSLSGQIEFPTDSNIFYLLTSAPTEYKLLYFDISSWQGHFTASICIDGQPIQGLSNIIVGETKQKYYPDDSSSFYTTESAITLVVSDITSVERAKFTLALRKSVDVV